MTAAEAMLRQWPTIKHAVSWVELFMEQKNDDDPESSMNMIRNANVPPDEALTMIQDCIEDEIACGSQGKHDTALAETKLPEFKVWLAGKLGLM